MLQRSDGYWELLRERWERRGRAVTAIVALKQVWSPFTKTMLLKNTGTSGNARGRIPSSHLFIIAMPPATVMDGKGYTWHTQREEKLRFWLHFLSPKCLPAHSSRCPYLAFIFKTNPLAIVSLKKSRENDTWDDGLDCFPGSQEPACCWNFGCNMVTSACVQLFSPVYVFHAKLDRFVFRFFPFWRRLFRWIIPSPGYHMEAFEAF